MRLQQFLHTIEEGRGARVLKFIVALLGFILLAGMYDFRAYKNFSAPEAMDAAQVARNLSQGKGFTTDYVRPLSVYLLRTHRSDRDPQTLEHPDLANAPFYPTLLAGVLAVLPFDYNTPLLMSARTYRPEVIITALNQVLFFLGAVLIYYLGRRVFDRTVGAVSAIVFVTAEVFWRFSISGLSTMLLLNLVLGVAWCLVRLDEEQRKDRPNTTVINVWSIIAGILVGLCMLTRYSFIFLLAPVAIYIAMLHPRFRGRIGVGIFAIALVLIAPWIVRNFIVSGTPFGTAGYAAVEGTISITGDTLQRSLHPDFLIDRLRPYDFIRKIIFNARPILQNDLPRLGGNWLAAFFLVGLLSPFKSATASKLRLFTVASLALFVVVQALGQTALSDITKEINSENLIVIFAPLVFIFGVGFFFIMVERLAIPFVAVTQAIITLLIAINVLPLALDWMAPRVVYSYPPYFPPLINNLANLMGPKEMMMSDIPWAVAWYGQRDCSLLTLNSDTDFTEFNKTVRPVSGLYFSRVTMDSKLSADILTYVVRNQKPWSRFVWEAITRGEAPEGFPLTKAWLNLLPDHLFMSDAERWKAVNQSQ